MVGCEKDTDFLKIDGVKLGQGAELAAGTQEENTFVYVFFSFCFGIQKETLQHNAFRHCFLSFPKLFAVAWCALLDLCDVFIPGGVSPDNFCACYVPCREKVQHERLWNAVNLDRQ